MLLLNNRLLFVFLVENLNEQCTFPLSGGKEPKSYNACIFVIFNKLKHGA